METQFVQKIYTADPSVDVAGSAAKSMVDNLATSDIQDIIERHGLGDIQPGDWVPLHEMCGMFNDAEAILGGGAAQVYVAMGMKIAEQSEFPSEMLESLTMEVMLMGWNDHYKANHRGAQLADVASHKISDTSFELHFPADGYPYPYNLAYGMAFGFCKKLLPKGINFKVEYDDVHSPYADWTEGVVLRV
ncbi:MAG: hypothetical protein AAF125_25540, partial [Chloroflexota bacterium]